MRQKPRIIHSSHIKTVGLSLSPSIHIKTGSLECPSQQWMIHRSWMISIHIKCTYLHSFTINFHISTAKKIRAATSSFRHPNGGLARLLGLLGRLRLSISQSVPWQRNVNSNPFFDSEADMIWYDVMWYDIKWYSMCICMCTTVSINVWHTHMILLLASHSCSIQFFITHPTLGWDTTRCRMLLPRINEYGGVSCLVEWRS